MFRRLKRTADLATRNVLGLWIATRDPRAPRRTRRDDPLESHQAHVIRRGRERASLSGEGDFAGETRSMPLSPQSLRP